MNLRSSQPVSPPGTAAGGVTPGAQGAAPAKAGHGYTTLADVAAAAGTSGASSLPKPRKLGGMALLIVVLLVGAALLMGMRKLGMTRRIEMVDFKIDYPIEKAELAKLSKDHEDVLRELNSSGELVQVPLDQVQTNPFSWKLSEKRAKSENKDDAALEAELARKAAEAARRQVESRAATLKLNGVMGGRVPVANIGGTLVKVGDLVDEFFIVESIEGRSVTLKADDMTFTLEMGEGKKEPAPRR